MILRHMNPAFAAAHIGQGVGREGAAALNDLLDDFGSLLDTEPKLLLSLATILISVMFGLASAIIVRPLPQPPSARIICPAVVLGPHLHLRTSTPHVPTRALPLPRPQIMASPYRVHWAWHWSLGVSIVSCLGAVIWMVEPRPSHWLPSLSRFEHAAWTSGWNEQRQRMRRWWRWRKKYAVNTKLNV